MQNETSETFPIEIKAPRSSAAVKIYRTLNRGRESFMLVWYSDNQRKREFRASLDEANARAMEVSRDVGKGITAPVAITSRERDDYAAANEIASRLGLTVTDTARRCAKAIEILGEDLIIEAARYYKSKSVQKIKPVQLSAAAAEFVAVKRKGDRDGRRSYADDVERHLALLAGVLQMHVSEVTTDDLKLFFGNLKCAPRTFNNIRATVSSFFKWCKKPSQRYIAPDWNEMDVDKAKLPDSEIQIYTAAELRKLIGQAPASLVPFLAIGAFAGLRSDEIRKLDWQDVHLDRRHIEVKAGNAKTAARRLVPITDNLALWLEKHRKASGLVWPHSKPYLYELLRSVAAKAELTVKDNGLRHSFISYRVAQSQDVPRVALEAGNSPKMVFAHYRELVTEDDAKAWFAILPESKPTKKERKQRQPSNVIKLQVAA